jgi:hypothetical protein
VLEVVLHKAGVLAVAGTLALTTTGLVAFTLRETHARVLRFSLQARHQRRLAQRVSPLLLAHSVETLAFIPVPPPFPRRHPSRAPCPWRCGTADLAASGHDRRAHVSVRLLLRPGPRPARLPRAPRKRGIRARATRRE